MFYSTWICIVLILGFISQSYELNEKIRYRRHQKRESPLRSMEQQIINHMISNQDDLKTVIRNSTEQEILRAEAISRQIIEAANLIATIATSNIANSTIADKFSIIKTQIRNGINLVIQSYRTFINFHRQTCDSVENVARNMITKYESELNLVDNFQFPTQFDYSDITNAEYRLKLQQLKNLLNYAQLHAATLPLATTCSHGMLDASYLQHAAVSVPTGQTRVLHVIYTDPEVQNIGTRSIDVPCDALHQYTNLATCSAAIATRTTVSACQVLPTCPLQQQQQYVPPPPPILYNKK